jgi:tRNA-Thr(GGU) m(6)t(6)A37 methyltransferase TsaA
MHSVTLTPIGVIHTPFSRPEGTPIQPSMSGGARGTVEVWPEYAEGLNDLDGFSHMVVLYWFHLSEGWGLKVTPFLDDRAHGVFATRAPKRPNPIGLSVLELLQVRGSILDVANVDMVDGTPLLDIKPYVPQFDCDNDVQIGWLDGKILRHPDGFADSRFVC